MPAQVPAPDDQPWWRRPEIPLLVILVVVAHFVRAGDLPLHGEEPTRAQAAFEMVQRRDWLVSRQQGEPFLIRPPLQPWVIAVTCLAQGSWSERAVRSHALLATLLTVLMIYGYSRIFLGRLGAFAAAAAFATMADMFKMGLNAETDAMFILLVSGSLLMWHWGLMRRWPETLTWAAGYSLMALAMMTKGIQAPAYFVGASWGYLILTGQGRRIISWGHAVGVMLWAAILLAWIIPFQRVMGWPAVSAAWLADPAVAGSWRFWTWSGRTFAIHLVSFPLEIAAGTLPWSLMLLLYARRDFRQALGAARSHVLFLTLAAVLGLLTCWIPIAGRPRFFAPFFPCLAVLIGLAIERCTVAAAPSPLGAAWRRYLGTMAVAMVAAAVAVLILAILGRRRPALSYLAEPIGLAMLYAVTCAALATLVFRARAGVNLRQVRQAVLALVAFLVITFTGVVADVRLRQAEDPAGDVRRLKAKLPPGQQLVSYGQPLGCLFPYYYGTPLIALQPWPAPGSPLDPALPYFCVEAPGTGRLELPFAWEKIGTVALDRNHKAVVERVMVIGRRLPPTTAPAKSDVAGAVSSSAPGL